MKSQFLLFGTIFLFLTTLAQAQNWGADGARWWYDSYGYGYSGYIELFADGDTIIKEQSCKIYKKKTLIYTFLENKVFEGFLPPDFIYELNSVVYIYLKDNNKFDTLYNFSAAIGDFWTTQRYEFADIIKTTVLNKGEKNINGQNLHWLLLEYNKSNTFSSIIQDTVYERIGNTRTYFYPWDYFERQLDGGEGGALRCYQDNEIGHFRRTMEDFPCDFVTANNEIELNNFIQIVPNPFTDVIKISFTKPITNDLELIIHSIEGRVIKKMKLSSNIEQFEIPAADLHRGYYILTLVENGAVLYVTKMAKI